MTLVDVVVNSPIGVEPTPSEVLALYTLYLVASLTAFQLIFIQSKLFDCLTPVTPVGALGNVVPPPPPPPPDELVVAEAAEEYPLSPALFFALV